MTAVPNRYEREPQTRGQIARRNHMAGLRARTFDQAEWFEEAREACEQYPCPPAPHGCGAPAGYTCHVIGMPDLELNALPAHVRRMQAAGLLPSRSSIGDGALRDTDRDPGAPVPAANREPGSGAIHETASHEPGWAPTDQPGGTRER